MNNKTVNPGTEKESTMICTEVGTMSSSLDVLRSYPAQFWVSEIYDDDQVFSSALRDVFGDSFEYPDFSHRTVGAVVKMAMKASAVEAETIARVKGPFNFMNASIDQSHVGKVIGVTGSHVVLSLGHSAAIVAQSDLSRVPAMDENISVVFKGGKGSVSGVVLDSAVDRGR